MKKLLLASTSTVHGSPYLAYLMPRLKSFFSGCNTLLFIPYARPGGMSHQAYTEKVKETFKALNITVAGIHEYESPAEAIASAEAIFTGGGNTFVLLNNLYKNNCINALKTAINGGTPYLGTSAGSNICGLTINTTNDMPIVYPPSFKALGCLPFNVNPHYLDPEPNSTHMGETRETRIKEFHTYHTFPVVGLREGSWLELNNHILQLKGAFSARIFEYNKQPYELNPEETLQHLN
ncbi:dipeptidase PepE [Bizionia sediminis]|uniref:Dipeptidase PepE n=1 Tax=Bizionia sediminis TaxID=1737064 RepID=A0ABW5KVA1_9FLAO